MEPDNKLHEVSLQIRMWLPQFYPINGTIPPVEVGYADDTSWLKIGECCVWESENGGEIGELGREDRHLTFQNAIWAYKTWVANLARVLKEDGK